MSRPNTGRYRLGSRRNKRTSTRPVPRSTHSNLKAQLTFIAPVLLGLVAFVGGVLGVHYGWQALAGSERLTVRTIDVRGATRVRPEEIVTFSGLATGMGILHADLDGAALQLRRHPWVRTAYVQRRLPDRLTVDITEHEPAVVVALGDLYLADGDGVVFKRLTGEDRVALPVVTGLGREQITNEPTETQVLIRNAATLATAGHEKAESLGRVDELHWDADLGWSIVFGAAGGTHKELVVHLGWQPEDRLALAVSAFGQLKKQQLVPAVLWADGIKNPRRVHARLAGQPTDNDPTFIAKAR